LVADGHPKQIFETSNRVLHVSLPKGNGDYGNTPRALAGLLAGSYGFDAVAFLDGDNWYEPDHIEKMTAVFQQTRAPLVSCKRTFRHLDGSVLHVTESAEDRFLHVDTNCWLVNRSAFSLFPAFRVPKQCGIIGDRVFFKKAQLERFPITQTNLRTVNYRTKYPDHYQKAGVALPEGAYTKDDMREAAAYLQTVQGVEETVAAVGFYPRLP
jgi:hypothetical protein